MKANELRIGNLVQVGNEIVEIIWFDYDGAVCQTLDNKSQVDMPIEPIPITEDILLKCGFEELKQSKGQYVIISESSYAIQLEIMFGFLKDGSMLVHLNDCDFDLKYLHQLQNLYYALTNEELTVKN